MRDRVVEAIDTYNRVTALQAALLAEEKLLEAQVQRLSLPQTKKYVEATRGQD